MWDAYENLEVDHAELVRSYPLTSADLLRLVTALPPIPQAWYDEDFSTLLADDPFADEWGGE